jgi:membrane protein DedA with SNARE-associated domain
MDPLSAVGTADVTSSIGVTALAALFATVTLGAIVPVVPTGAAVSASAAYAWHHEPIVLVLSVAAGAAGAYVGDLGTYAMCRVGGRALARRLRWLRDEDHLVAVEDRLRASPIRTLLVSRLIPGGRIPVLLAAAFLGLDWRTFLIANAPACALWAVVYAAIGTIGGSIFPEPWQGVLAAVVLVLVVTQVLDLVAKRKAAGEKTAKKDVRPT